MTTSTRCDHCGKTIEGRSEIAVHVVDSYVPKMSDLKAKHPPSLFRQLDLHRACYEATLLPAITALVPPPST